MHYIALIDGKLFQTHSNYPSAMPFEDISWVDWNAEYEYSNGEFLPVIPPPPEPPTFEELRSAKLAELEVNWQAFVAQGYVWNGVRFKIDDASRLEFNNGRLSLIARGVPSTDLIGFNVVGYHEQHGYPLVFSTWTVGEYLNFCNALENWWIAGWNTRTNAIAAIVAATTEAELDAVDIEVGT